MKTGSPAHFPRRNLALAPLAYRTNPIPHFTDLGQKGYLAKLLLHFNTRLTPNQNTLFYAISFYFTQQTTGTGDVVTAHQPLSDSLDSALKLSPSPS